LSLLHDIVIATYSLNLVVISISLVVDVCKFNFVIFIWWRGTSEAAWFHEEHYWYADDHEDKEHSSNLEFLVLGFTDVWVHLGVFWFGTAEVENEIDHDIDD
tara:strand:- start:154 stop:459 length:306 start_codon:yes stop_codon:yes gene_type:complete